MDINYVPKYNYNDYKSWEGRWELISGFPYAMSPLPSINHQEVSGKILAQLLLLLENCEKCKPLLPVDWKIDEETLLQPDNSVVCEPVGGNYLTKPPILIFEVLSPSTAFKDKNIKYKIYESQGVKYYVIVDIEKKMAGCYELKDNQYELMAEARDHVIHFDLNHCQIEFPFSSIWDR